MSFLCRERDNEINASNRKSLRMWGGELCIISTFWNPRLELCAVRLCVRSRFYLTGVEMGGAREQICFQYLLFFFSFLVQGLFSSAMSGWRLLVEAGPPNESECWQGSRHNVYDVECCIAVDLCACDLAALDKKGLPWLWVPMLVRSRLCWYPLAVVAGDFVYIDGGEIFVATVPFDTGATISSSNLNGNHIAGVCLFFMWRTIFDLIFDRCTLLRDSIYTMKAGCR